MATWKELEAQGVKRCGAVYTNGKRCRCKAAEGSWWCPTHREMIESVVAQRKEADV